MILEELQSLRWNWADVKETLSAKSLIPTNPVPQLFCSPLLTLLLVQPLPARSASVQEVGQRVRDCPTCSEMVGIPAGTFGLRDTLGNVSEWTRDCWNERYSGGPMDGTAWESGDCTRRVTRGGSWINQTGNLRAANRYPYSVDQADRTIGFRVARVVARRNGAAQVSAMHPLFGTRDRPEPGKPGARR